MILSRISPGGCDIFGIYWIVSKEMCRWHWRPITRGRAESRAKAGSRASARRANTYAGCYATTRITDKKTCTPSLLAKSDRASTACPTSVQIDPAANARQAPGSLALSAEFLAYTLCVYPRFG